MNRFVAYVVIMISLLLPTHMHTCIYYSYSGGHHGYHSDTQEPPFVVQPAGMAVYEPATQMRVRRLNTIAS